MTLEEAIKELLDLEAGDILVGREKAALAERLGIEALKEINRHRRPTNLAIIGLLPGETED